MFPSSSAAVSARRTRSAVDADGGGRAARSDSAWRRDQPRERRVHHEGPERQRAVDLQRVGGHREARRDAEHPPVLRFRLRRRRRAVTKLHRAWAQGLPQELCPDHHERRDGELRGVPTLRRTRHPKPVLDAHHVTAITDREHRDVVHEPVVAREALHRSAQRGRRADGVVQHVERAGAQHLRGVQAEGVVSGLPHGLLPDRRLLRERDARVGVEAARGVEARRLPHRRRGRPRAAAA